MTAWISGLTVPTIAVLGQRKNNRKVGKFYEKQQKTLKDLFNRRFEGKTVSTNWIKVRMRYHCNTDKPAGYNKAKNKFTETWVRGFMKRNGLSIRKKQTERRAPSGKRFIKLKIITISQSI